MTSKRDSQELTRVGPGTVMGDLMRQYWIPAAQSDELVADGDPVRLVLLGEKLIAFRDSNGKVGVMDHRCPHRCASLFFGRNEEGGIRCVYHGWKFDADGNCLDMANVPPHQDFKHKVHAKAYRAVERRGLVWVFMGDQDRVPELPAIESTLLPEDDLAIDFVQRECNWLQALEGDIDTSHVDFLHGGKRPPSAFPEGDPRRWGTIHRDPEYKVTDTDWGVMYGAYRPADPGNLYWRIAHFIMPFWSITPAGVFDQHIIARAWVPLDDTHTMGVAVRRKSERVKVSIPVGVGEMMPNTTDWFGRYRAVACHENDYMIDRGAQKEESYTGITGINLQDQAITESMGGITDHSFEHLAPSDEMITTTRRRLLRAARDMKKDGTRPPAADDTSAYFGARGGYYVAPEDRDWLDVYRDNVAAAHRVPLAQAAE